MVIILIPKVLSLYRKNKELERELANLNHIRKLDAKTKRKLNEEAQILKEKADEVRQNQSDKGKSRER